MSYTDPLDEVNRIREQVHNREQGSEQEQNRNNAEQKKRNLFVPIEELMAQKIERRYLVEGFLEKNTLSQYFGETGCFKSFVLTDLGLSIATGTSWHGHAITQKGPVVFIVGEGHAGLARRFKAWEIARQATVSNCYISRCATDLFGHDGQDTVLKELAELDITPVLIIVDTLARNIGGGDENSSKDVHQVIRFLDKLRERYDCAAIIAHHTGHKNHDRGRGSSGLPAAIDYNYQVTKADRKATLTCRKNKDDELLAPMYFELRTVELDDTSDKPQTSLVPFLVDADGTKSTKKYDQLRGATKIAFNALTDCLSDEGARVDIPVPVKEHIGFLAPKFVVTEDTWRQRCILSGISEGEEKAKRVAFTRARTTLLDLEKVQTWDGFYWT